MSGVPTLSGHSSGWELFPHGADIGIRGRRSDVAAAFEQAALAATAIDLHELPNPRETLDEVRVVLAPERVLVVTPLGGLTGEEVRGLGFNVVERPATIGQIVAATGALLSRPLAEQGPAVAPPSRTD